MKLLVTHLLVIRKNKIVEKDVVPSIELNVVRKILAKSKHKASHTPYDFYYSIYVIEHTS